MFCLLDDQSLAASILVGESVGDCASDCVALAGSLADDLPLERPAIEPVRDKLGDADPLASVHPSPSSLPSLPMSK